MTLLKELQESNSTISTTEQEIVERSYEFGNFAFEVFMLNNNNYHQRSVRGGGGDENLLGTSTRRDWLKWWELTPDLDQLVLEQRGQGQIHSVQGGRGKSVNLPRLKKYDVDNFTLARKVSKELVQSLELELIEKSREEEGGGGGGGVVELVEEMKQFGEMLARKGQARVVAEELIFEMALNVRQVESALELWETTLSELVRQGNRFDGDNDEMEEWFMSKNYESLKVLIRAKGQIIKALTNLGEVDEAVEILLNPSPSCHNNVRLYFDKKLYLVILAQLSHQDRFDLFERVYQRFEQNGYKLVRIKNERLKYMRSPYLARSNRYPDSDGPSAQEAFTTFRDQHAVSSIEEGSLLVDQRQKEEEETLREYAAITGEDVQHYGRSTSQSESRAIVQLVETGQLDLAFDKLNTLLEKGPLPSAQSVATLLHSIDSHANGQLALEMIDDSVKDSYWRRGFWATCRMLKDLQSGNLQQVVRRFRDHFDLKGLPLPLIAAIKGTTLNTVSTRRRETCSISTTTKTTTMTGRRTRRRTRFETSTSNAYTVAILFQALVPLLSNSHPTSGAPQHLKRIFHSLFDPCAFRIIPSHNNNNNNNNNINVAIVHLGNSDNYERKKKNKSPLDPYTFIPFLLLNLQQRGLPLPSSFSSSNTTKEDDTGGGRDKVCQGTLTILRSMQNLGIKPQLPHISLLLSAYATRSSSSSTTTLMVSGSGGREGITSRSQKEFRYLLDCLERGSSSIRNLEEIDGEISSDLIDFVKYQFGSSNTTTINDNLDLNDHDHDRVSPKLYATLLKSLRLQRMRCSSDGDETKQEEIKLEAMGILKRLMERIGVQGLREMLESREGEGMRSEVGRLGIRKSSV